MALLKRDQIVDDPWQQMDDDPELPSGIVDTVIATYRKQRQDGEQFGDTYRRVGAQPFKDDLYGTA